MGEKRYPSEARPRCPECAAIIDPETAVCYGRPKSIHDLVLVGVYCSADCILDAVDRGYPRYHLLRS